MLVLLVATPIRSTVVIALLLLYAIGYLVAHRRELTLTRLDRWAMLLLGAMLLGRLGPFVVGGFSARYLSSGLHMAASIPIFLMLRHALTPGGVARCRPWLEWGVILGSLGGALVALYQTQWLGMGRAEGFLFSINFGYLSAVLMSLAIGLAMMATPRRGLLLLAALGGLLAVMLSGTRGAMLVLPGIVVVLALLRGPLLGLGKTAALGGVVVAVMLVTYHSVPMVESRIDRGIAEVSGLFEGELTEQHGSTGYRLNLWWAALQALEQRPLIGLSYAERESLNQTLVEGQQVVPWVASVSRGHAHSQYFETLATGGLIGLLALMGYLVAPGLYHGYRLRQDHQNPFALAGVMLTVSVAICGLTEVLLQQEMIAAVYAYLQATLAALALARSPEHSSTT